MPLLVHGALQLLAAQGAFQRREQMRQGLRVIPNVGAGACAAAAVGEASFPGPDIAVFLSQNGRRLQDGEVGSHRIQDSRRHRR